MGMWELMVILDMQDQLVRITVELYMKQRQMPKDELNDNSKD